MTILLSIAIAAMLAGFGVAIMAVIVAEVRDERRHAIHRARMADLRCNSAKAQALARFDARNIAQQA